jgi:hypothetical protein
MKHPVDRRSFLRIAGKAASQGGSTADATLEVAQVELTSTEFGGLSGIRQMIKSNAMKGAGSSNDAD